MVAFVHLLAVAGPVFVIASLAMPAGIGGRLHFPPLIREIQNSQSMLNACEWTVMCTVFLNIQRLMADSCDSGQDLKDFTHVLCWS